MSPYYARCIHIIRIIRLRCIYICVRRTVVYCHENENGEANVIKMKTKNGVSGVLNTGGKATLRCISGERTNGSGDTFEIKLTSTKESSSPVSRAGVRSEHANHRGVIVVAILYYEIAFGGEEGDGRDIRTHNRPACLPMDKRGGGLHAFR